MIMKSHKKASLQLKIYNLTSVRAEGVQIITMTNGFNCSTQQYFLMLPQHYVYNAIARAITNMLIHMVSLTNIKIIQFKFDVANV